MMKTLFCLLATILCLQAQAQKSKTLQTLPEEPPVPHQTPVTEPDIKALETPTVEAPSPVESSLMARGLTRYTGQLHWSPLSSWIPSKFGASLGYIFNERWTLEGEYTSKSISAKLFSVDFGKITDRRFGLQGRWYPGSSNSFHFILGLFKSELSAEIGNTVINNIGTVPSQTVLKYEALGPQLGLANRWQWSNGFGFGVDWLVIYIPMINKTKDDQVLQSVTNTTDRSDLDKVTSAVSNLPQFDLLRLQVGYSF